MNYNAETKQLIAVVDDDPGITEVVERYLTGEGWRVKSFKDAETFLHYLEEERPDLIILDIVLPGMSGLEACKILRETERFRSIPVIMLSGKAEYEDKISGLDLGADDYVTKPFSLGELNSRVKAVLRRLGKEEEEKKVTIGPNIVIDLQRYEVTVRGQKAELTVTEFKILELLASKRGQVFSRERILDYLWGEEKIVIPRTIDVHIRHLREKLGADADLIVNVRGIGYKLEEDPPESY